MENFYFNLNYSFRWRFCLPLESDARGAWPQNWPPSSCCPDCVNLRLQLAPYWVRFIQRILWHTFYFTNTLTLSCPFVPRSSKWAFFSLPAGKHLYSFLILALQFAYHVCLSALNSISLAMFNATCDHKLFCLVCSVLLLRTLLQTQKLSPALHFQTPFVLGWSARWRSG